MSDANQIKVLCRLPVVQEGGAEEGMLLYTMVVIFTG